MCADFADRQDWGGNGDFDAVNAFNCRNGYSPDGRIAQHAGRKKPMLNQSLDSHLKSIIDALSSRGEFVHRANHGWMRSTRR